LSKNQPCHFEGLASAWPAVEKWKVDSSDNSYLKQKLEGQTFGVHTGRKAKTAQAISLAYTFHSEKKRVMSFDDFLLESKASPGQVTLKNESTALKSLLQGDIKVPEFYDHISDVERISLFLGSHFMDKPQYIKNEQMMCVVNGAASVVLVAHVHK